MLKPSDQEYKQTRLIKLGKASMEAKFIAFAEWLNKKYAVQVLNIYTDVINDDTLRLQLIFEYETDLNKFFLKDRFTTSKYIVKTIEKKYKELFQIMHPQPVLVLFYAFEPLAKEEVNTSVPQETIMSLKEKYKNTVWEIARFGQHVTFFFYTKAQLKGAQRDGLTINLKQAYFEILRENDELNYFTLANLNAIFDSKENFDKNYDGNWRAYYS